MEILYTILFYLIPNAFIFFFSFYTKWQIQDELDGIATWTVPDKKWHRFGLLMRLSFFLAMVGWFLGEHINPYHLIILAPIIAINFDLGINIARKRKLFAVGTGGWDKKISFWKWPFYVLWLAASIYFFIYKN